jgi:hypothetical protein
VIINRAADLDFVQVEIVKTHLQQRPDMIQPGQPLTQIAPVGFCQQIKGKVWAGFNGSRVMEGVISFRFHSRVSSVGRRKVCHLVRMGLHKSRACSGASHII